MYVPKYSQVTDIVLLKDFILSHSFGTLVTKDLNANHYPFLLAEEKGEIILYTHLARSNPQWQNIHDKDCVVIFTGPHSYISPLHYVNPLNVPTWSYTAVHAQCTAEVISDSEKTKQLMKSFVAHFENQNGTSWDYNLPEDFHEKLLKAIVWVKLKVHQLEGKFKLSQNRDEADYTSLRKALEKDSSDNMKEMLKLMDATTPYPSK